MLANSNNSRKSDTIVLTGDRPTGALHLGHYVGSLANRCELQQDFQQFILIADMQALTDNFENPEKIRHNLVEVMLDYLAVGLKPEANCFFLQSQIPELAELFMILLNLVTLERLGRNPTVKQEIQQKGYDITTPAGFFCYPVSQAADITAFRAELVPVGADQLPMIEQTNEIVRRFNRIYNSDALIECRAQLGNTERLIGIDGQSKASKSLGNAIFLKDEPAAIQSKVFSMFTDPQHLKISDPGKVEGNAVFCYLDAFYSDKEHLAELKAHYQRGGLGDMTIKKLLNETLQNFLAPIREKRQQFSEKYIFELLEYGRERARKVASTTLSKVKNAIGLWA